MIGKLYRRYREKRYQKAVSQIFKQSPTRRAHQMLHEKGDRYPGSQEEWVARFGNRYDIRVAEDGVLEIPYTPVGGELFWDADVVPHYEFYSGFYAATPANAIPIGLMEVGTKVRLLIDPEDEFYRMVYTQGNTFPGAHPTFIIRPGPIELTLELIHDPDEDKSPVAIFRGEPFTI